MSTCRLLSVLVCQGLRTGLEIRLSQRDVPHNTHMHKHPVTGLPVKQSEHEGPEDLAGGKGANRERKRGEECRILEGQMREEGRFVNQNSYITGNGEMERQRVKEESTNIPTKLLLGPTHPSMVQPRIPHTHTRTHSRLHFALDALALCVCVSVWLLTPAVPVRQQAEHSVHSPVKPALQALFLRTELLAEQKQMWVPSPLFLHLGSASSPPQILSLTPRN